VLSERIKHLIVGGYLLAVALHWFVFPRKDRR
jgi:hypothetical protein